MDEDILRTVEKISGKLSRDCYYDLCCLVKAAHPPYAGHLLHGDAVSGGAEIQ